MRKAAKELLNQALGASSQATYKRAWGKFSSFAQVNQLKQKFPIDTNSLFLFVVHLQSAGYAPATISSYVSALSYLHKIANRPDPAAAFIVKKSLQTVQKLNPTMDKRLPITEEILQVMISKIHIVFPNSYQQRLYNSMFLLAFNAFLRVGEITDSEHNLWLSDIEQTKEGFDIRFRTAKHAAGKEQQVSVHTSSCGKMCPVIALNNYLRLRGKQAGPLYLSYGKPLSRHEFVKSLKCVLTVAGIPSDRFNSHSFRIGAATSCAEKGATDVQIRKLGRWKSDAFKRYIRTANPLQSRAGTSS